MRCRRGTKKRSSFQETGAKSDESNKNSKTKHGCIVDARESTSLKDHEYHVAGKGYNSMTHYNLVHKFIPMPQVMKIPDAKTAVDKEWKKLVTIPAWQLEKSRARWRFSSKHEETKRKSTLLH